MSRRLIITSAFGHELRSHRPDLLAENKAPCTRQSQTWKAVGASALSGILMWFVSQGSIAVQAMPSLDRPMIVTQVPAKTKAAPPGWDAKGLVRADWFEGARVIVVSPDGNVRVLSQGFHSACDPDVSFDGQRVLFAGKKERESRWRIWEISLDGQSLHPVSPENLEARSPIYVSTLFTLDSPEPWFTTVFVGREQTANELGRASASSLYNVKLNGSELRRLTFNPNNNFDPFQMWDGRVIYSAERYPNQPGASGGRVGLYAIHVEGADMESYGGELGGRIQHMGCSIERGLTVFVESEPANWDGAGQLACLEQRRPHVTYQRLSKDAAQVFLYPSAWRDNLVLVSRRSAKGKDTCGVFSFNTDTRQCELIFDSPDFHDVQAKLVKPRPRPDGHSTVVDTKLNTGIFYGLNCYDTDRRMAPHLQAGIVKRVRFIEGVPQSASAKSPPVLRRLVGEAPVETDGSFNVEVPVDTPLLLQTLDGRGLALANCGWIWVKPKEKRGCIGCHEDPERIPENEYVLALRRPSNLLTLPPAQRRSVSFRQDIAPLLQKHCATADCHDGKNTPFRLPLASAKPDERELLQAYEALMVPAELQAKDSVPRPAPGKYVDPGRARTSPLIWQLTGTNTSRPWDHSEKSVGARKLKPMPHPSKGTSLSEEELRTIVQWIDMGAQFDAVKPSELETKKLPETK